MARHSIQSLLFCIFLGFSAMACGGSVPWQVVSQENPNPLKTVRQFSVLPIEYKKLTVGAKSESSYLADKDEEKRSAWEADKVALSQEFSRALMVEARGNNDLIIDIGDSDAPFVVQPRIRFIEPGLYIGIYSKESKIDMSATIRTADGRLVDEIRMSVEGAPGFSISERMRASGARLGEWMADYLETRTRVQ